MDEKDFRKDFLEEVKSTAATTGEGSALSFVNIAAEYLQNAEVIPDFTPAFYIPTDKSSKKMRVDGYTFDEFDFTMNLVIADYSNSEDEKTLTKAIAIQQFDKLLNFIEAVFNTGKFKEIEPSTPAADLVELMRFHSSRIRKYRLILLSDGLMNDKVYIFEAKDYANVPVECQIWNIERLFKVCFSDIGRQNIEIDFKSYMDKGIQCLEARNSNTDEYKSFLCIMPGEALADIYDYYGSQLLEGNVRSFLSTKVAVNKKIRETIIKIPEMFFALNNGVAATAMNLRFEEYPEGRYITFAEDFQIINGGQTTASLSNARHRDKASLADIYVQMKLTEIDSDPDKSNDLIRNISRSSNNQNKVSDADFFSTHPFHIRMEQISRRIFAPGTQFDTRWFYERARGQYLQAQMRMTKTEKEKFVAQHPKRQLLTKTDIAKVRNTWRGLPQIVSRGAQTNFMKFAEIIDEEWAATDTKFNDKYFKESVALMILFKHTENIVSHQPWYEQGYRANIVTYSIALLHKLIKDQFPGAELDLQILWNKQEVPDVITNELILITKIVFDAITDISREVMNVTQWCKRDSCWSKIKEKKLLLDIGIEKVLLEKSEIKIAERDAKKDQKIISDFEAQQKVLEFGVDNWRRVNDFVQIKKIASPDALTALKYAMQIPEKFPNVIQCQKLLELLEKALAEGYKI